jgi:VWFA-related protein
VDRNGQLRNDLGKSDFQVTEDGVPQTILDFEAPAAHIVSSAQSIDSTRTLEEKAPHAPVNIVVLDEMNTSFQDMAYARYALKRYLNAQPQSMMAPTMLIAVNFDKFTVLRDYTQNRAEILRALDHHLTHYPWNLERGESRFLNYAKSLGALEQIAEGTRGHAGHKNIIWVGKGFPGINLSSPGISGGAVEGVTNAVHQAVNMLRDSRVTLYTIDPTMLTATIAVTSDADSVMGGLDGGMDATAPDPFEGDVSFTGLAKATGGKSFYSRNDVDREIGESARDGVNYYSIMYRPSNNLDTDRPYRRIRIAFSQPGLHALYRDGYYTKEDPVPTTVKSRMTYDLDAAEESTMVYTGMSVSVVPKPGTPDAFLVSVPADQLAWNPDGAQESARLRVIAADVNNRNEVLQRTTEVLTAHRPVSDGKQKDAHKMVAIAITLQKAPNTFRLRFIMRDDADGRIGSADIPIPGAPPAKNTR